MISIESSHRENPRTELLRKLKGMVKERFSERKHPYHNYNHSVDVDVVSLRVFDAIEAIDPSLISEQNKLAREVTAYGHDSDIEYDIFPSGPMEGTRDRKRGFFEEDMSEKFKAEGGPGNERASSDNMISLIDEVDPDHQVFKEKVITEIELATAATLPKGDIHAEVPEEKWETLNPKARKYFDEKGRGLLISQPHLRAESGVTEFSIALADLSAGGIMPVEISLERGDAEYRETRDWVVEKIESGIANIPNDQKKRMIDDMRNWLKTQVQFYVWRKLDTEKVISEHVFKTTKEKSDKIKESLLIPMMQRYDEVIAAAIARSERFETPEYEGKSLVAVDLNKQLALLASELGYFDQISSQ